MDGNDSSKQYSLRWEKHAFNLASEAGCFFEDESFLDCTLSAEGQCIDAHKIILSASSSYLSNLLKIMPDKHPILIFNDIKFEQLKSLVAFIYNGSVNVSENNIHAFLNAAQSLLIKGLSEGNKTFALVEDLRPRLPSQSRLDLLRSHVSAQFKSREEDRFAENVKKAPRNVEVQDMRTNHRTHPKAPVLRKPDIYLEAGKNFKRHRQILSKSEGGGGGGPFVECEESLSKLQEISFTKYIHQNLNSKPHVRSEILENKWNGPGEEKLRAQDNYVVKSWKHNSVEDLNGRHKQNKNNSIKKNKLDKPINLRAEESDQNDKKNSEQTDVATGNVTERTKSDEMEDKIEREVDTEQIMLVEPKQEIMDEEDTNSEEFDSMPNANETIVPDSDSLYDSRSVPNFYQQPVVDRGVPVPLLMCRTSLSEPDSVEPNWMPQIAGNVTPDHPPPTNAIDNSAQDLQCRTCAQDLPCPTCTKKYKSRYALNRHILYECGKARKSFSCDECGKKVTRQDTLQKHKLIHLVQHLKKKESEGPPKPKKMC